MSVTPSTKTEKENVKSLKVVLIGEAAVGKSSIMYRYTMNSFSYSMLGTAGIDFKKKELEVDNQKIKIVLYDTAGHERFRKMVHSHCKGANGIMLVYDVGEERSIDNLKEWLSDLNANAKDVPIILVGNKCDIETRQISEEEGRELSETYKVPWIETSAKTGLNVELSFDNLLNEILKKEKEKEKEKIATENAITTIENKAPSNQQKKKETSGCKCVIF